jgi:hypothetical protein
VRWYFAIDEAGGLRQAGDYARLAVLTARAIGGLEPVLLYYGKPTAFTAWMAKNGVRIVETAPSFLDTILAAQAAGKYRAHSIGHWLRIAIPQIEQAHEFVLYTDCDVIFLRPADWGKMRPRVFAAAPEFLPDNWNYFNSGVMLLNVPAMRASYEKFETQIRHEITTGNPNAYDDQIALNAGYRGHWEKLDPVFNWKPYWKFNPNAAILHFHGPKIDAIEAIAAGRWPRTGDANIMLGKMLDAHVVFYAAWCAYLGDMLQTIDFAAALRYADAASALTRYAKTIAPVIDKSFMNIRIFAE